MSTLSKMANLFRDVEGRRWCVLCLPHMTLYRAQRDIPVPFSPNTFELPEASIHGAKAYLEQIGCFFDRYGWECVKLATEIAYGTRHGRSLLGRYKPFSELSQIVTMTYGRK